MNHGESLRLLLYSSALFLSHLPRHGRHGPVRAIHETPGAVAGCVEKISFHHPRVTPNVLHTNNKLGNNQPPFIVYIWLVVDLPL